MTFVSVSFLFLGDDFDLSVSSATRNRADQPIRPSACAKQCPERANCAARGRLRVLDLGRTTFGQCVEGQRAAAQSRSQYLLNRSSPRRIRPVADKYEIAPKGSIQRQDSWNHKTKSALKARGS